MAPSATRDDFKAKFDREFIFGTGRETIRDSDVDRAIEDAVPLFNPDLWVDVAEQKAGFLYCAAHMLAMNVQAAGGLSASPTNQGVNSPGGGGVIQQKSVGPASVSYALPDRVTQEPALAQFTRTGFGLRYLQMLTPRLVGAGFVVNGWRDVGPE